MTLILDAAAPVRLHPRDLIGVNVFDFARSLLSAMVTSGQKVVNRPLQEALYDAADEFETVAHEFGLEASFHFHPTPCGGHCHVADEVVERLYTFNLITPLSVGLVHANITEAEAAEWLAFTPGGRLYPRLVRHLGRR